MYDLECSIYTWIPFWLTFCIYNCVIGKLNDTNYAEKHYMTQVYLYIYLEIKSLDLDELITLSGVVIFGNFQKYVGVYAIWNHNESIMGDR